MQSRAHHSQSASYSMQRRPPIAPSASSSGLLIKSTIGRRERKVKHGRRESKRRSYQARRRRSSPAAIAVGIVAATTVLLLGGMATFLQFSKGTKLVLSRRLLRGHIVGSSYANSVPLPPSLFPPRYPMVTAGQDGVDASGSIDPDILDMCAKTLFHTLETTTVVLPENETFVHTGDIDAQWLRDSAGQVHPYLVPWFPGGALVSQDKRLSRVVSGLIRRVATYIRHDPYANSFNIDSTRQFTEKQRSLGRHDFVSTWNYELDSGCYFLRMLYFYWKAVPDAPVLRERPVQEAVAIMVELWINEQDHEADVYPKGPLFDCQNCDGPYRYPGLPRDGKGRPTKRTGMTWTGFRPSDDASMYGYLVPANMFAVVALGYVAEMSSALWRENEGATELASKATRLAFEINEGIRTHGIVDHPDLGRIYAYEVDGLGGFLLMDDANIPSLLSAPYLGYEYDPEVYANTKRFIFSKDNPNYQSGTNAWTGDIKSYGSPHMRTSIWQNVWPMALAMEGLTSESPEEKVKIINQLYQASAGTHWMHESFDVNNPKQFTRPWFCWADALFAELVMSVTDACPGIDQKYTIRWWKDPVLVPGGSFAGDQKIYAD